MPRRRYLDVPFFADSPREVTVVTPEGDMVVPIIHPSGCSKAFGAVERPLRQRGAVRDGFFGGALVQLMRGQAVIETVVEMLTANPGELLCTDPACYRCTESAKPSRGQRDDDRRRPRRGARGDRPEAGRDRRLSVRSRPFPECQPAAARRRARVPAVHRAVTYRDMALEIDVFQPDEIPDIEASPGWWPGSDFTDRPNVIGTRRGTGGGRSLLMLAHVDVVPEGPHELWRHGPFNPVVEDGALIGRGSADDKVRHRRADDGAPLPGGGRVPAQGRCDHRVRRG